MHFAPDPTQPTHFSDPPWVSSFLCSSFFAVDCSVLERRLAVPVLKGGVAHLFRLELEQFIFFVLRLILALLLVAVQHLVHIHADGSVEAGTSG